MTFLRYPNIENWSKRVVQRTHDDYDLKVTSYIRQRVTNNIFLV